MAVPLNQLSGMPQMAVTLNGWQKSIDIIKITQSVVDGIPVSAEQSIAFQGTVQPLDPESVKLKPEGQRSWEWLQIHVKSGSNNLKTDDRIKYNNVIFKIMGKKDYSLNGFLEYHAVADFT